MSNTWDDNPRPPEPKSTENEGCAIAMLILIGLVVIPLGGIALAVL